MSRTRYLLALEENDLDNEENGHLFASVQAAECNRDIMTAVSGRPWKVFKCSVFLPKEVEQRDALLAVCKEFDNWADGWCPQSSCCAASCREIADRARAAIELIPETQTIKESA